MKNLLSMLGIVSWILMLHAPPDVLAFSYCRRPDE
jgi:hypothetical protein